MHPRPAIPGCMTLGKLSPLELSFLIYKMGMLRLLSMAFVRIKGANVYKSTELGERHECSINIYQIEKREEEELSCP